MATRLQSVEWIIWPVLLAMLGTGCLLNGGCAMLDPGGTGRKMYDQRRSLSYSDQEFKTDAEGPQNESLEVIEAEGKIVLTPEGDIDIEKSILTSYIKISADPSSQAATQGLGAITQMGMQQSADTLAIVETIATMLGARASPPPTEVPP